jgi:putative Mn2+ efflux pump MntP
MGWNLTFFMESILFGMALAMDAFSVSLANGLHEPHMKKRKLCAIAGTFSFFQFLMPMLGWLCVRTILQCFSAVERWIPLIALALLGFIGGKMLLEGIRNDGSEEDEQPSVGFAALMVQGIATSIDALSVGLDIGTYDWIHAFVCGLLIAVVTFIICVVGLLLGKKVGMRFSGKASILGGVILILIALKIFLTAILA